MKKLLLAVSMFAFTVVASAWEPKSEVEANPNTVKTIRFEGSTDIDMLKEVRAAIEAVKAPKSGLTTLRIELASPGGPVVTSIEIARIIRKASDEGMIVEIHAYMMCASGCTMVLAAGTPGKRFIQEQILFLVHPIQQGSGFAPPTCVDHKDKPKDQDEKATNVFLEMMRDSYVKHTGQPKAVVEKWLICGNEQVGTGALAVQMKIADKTEK